jgi:putative PIN family toxin of toxin-antitoxin system
VVELFALHGLQSDDYLVVMNQVLDDAELVRPRGVAPPCRDEKDRKYLHCALEARVDYLVTLDNDLLDLGAIGTIPIIRPGQLLSLIRQQGSEPDP